MIKGVVMQYVQLWKDKERKEESEYETSLKHRERKNYFKEVIICMVTRRKKRMPREKENIFAI